MCASRPHGGPVCPFPHLHSVGLGTRRPALGRASGFTARSWKGHFPKVCKHMAASGTCAEQNDGRGRCDQPCVPRPRPGPRGTFARSRHVCRWSCAGRLFRGHQPGGGGQNLPESSVLGAQFPQPGLLCTPQTRMLVLLCTVPVGRGPTGDHVEKEAGVTACLCLNRQAREQPGRTRSGPGGLRFPGGPCIFGAADGRPANKPLLRGPHSSTTYMPSPR